MAGVSDPREVGRGPIKPAAMRFRPTQNVAASGGLLNFRETWDSAYLFVVTQIVGEIWITATSSPNIAGTPLQHWPDASPTASIGNTWPSKTLVEVNFSTPHYSYAKSRVAWCNLIGTLENPFEPALLFIGPGSDVAWEIYNGTSLSLLPEIIFHGYSLPVSS